jgi:TPP-dependent pyruvate/acetoin dehydrogenase alpha subunit
VLLPGQRRSAVNDLASRLIGEIRGGGGPRLLHAKTYRWTGHTSTDQAAWRDPEEVAAWKAKCPIGRLKANLMSKGLTEAEIAAIDNQAVAEMQAARAAANAAPWPAAPLAYEDVQDTGAHA